MSFIIYDRLSGSIARSNYEWSFYRTFDKFWSNDGTTYNERMVIYDGSPVYSRDDDTFRKFLNILGLKYDDVLSDEILDEFDKGEVEEYWFELVEPVTQSDGDEDNPQPITFTPQEALNYIPDFTVGQQFEIDFHYAGNASNYRLVEDYKSTLNIDNSDLSNPEYLEVLSLSPTEIRDAIMVNPGDAVLGVIKARPESSRGYAVLIDNIPFDELYFTPDTFNTISNKMDYPFKPLVECAYGYPGYYWYALFDGSFSNFQIVGMGDAKNSSDGGIEWRVKYEVIANVDENSDCIVSFLNKFNKFWFTNRYTAPEPIRETQKDYAIEHPLSKYPNSWSNGELLVDEAYAMKKGDFTLMIAESFSSDYSIEEPDWWEKALGVVISIAGVVVGVFLCCTGSGSSIISIGTALMGASATWALGALALGALGGASTYGMVKNIAGVAQFASIAGGIFTLFGSIGSGWRGFSEYMKQKYNDTLNFFSPNDNISVDNNNVIESFSGTSGDAIDNALEYAIDNNISLSKVFPNAKPTDDMLIAAIERYKQKQLYNRKLASGMFDLSTMLYNNYNRNMYEEEAKKIQEGLEDLQEMNDKNAPKNFYEVLGDQVFTYSMGSYDAIAMLDLKVEKQIGQNSINDDPGNSII